MGWFSQFINGLLSFIFLQLNQRQLLAEEFHLGVFATFGCTSQLLVALFSV